GLISPGQGLELPLRILAQAPEHLAPGGQLFCEVGESAGALEHLLPDLPFTWLQFKHGGDGVFTIGRDELMRHRPAVVRALENLNDVL
ncbi:MAG: 50S ribosomal protein L3 N(5)-glutamine methyltransferase, partial [Xanthomonadales bacterium]|nr:50S ribosomal protein L3 N(5)-glutamine methyltransferase [Xanthomonadales bacterium]